jgi:hypothetical protein
MNRLSLLFFALAAFALAQAPATPGPKPPAAPKPAGAKPAGAARPGLFFKEEWKQTPAGGEHEMNQESVANPALEFKHYGEFGHVLITGVTGNENNPIHTWSGECEAACGFALRHKQSFADLTGLARIRVNTKTSGFHVVRPMIKLADGNWYVADRADGNPKDWLYSEYLVSDLKWLKLNVPKMTTTGNYVENLDLTKVDEIGFVDLHAGSGHGPGGWSDVAQVEVYAKAVPR